ncbi:YaaC-like protein [Melghirimyces profundicolus]|uniref:YaaC-like protein n=1 Tax=Melghirimyces profundicolus TaxID=1242148 RepID=A0A2T6BAI1_9BACL|nr:YaaC family protein [Melghirimyces profundicolus]PTX53074.1 YaaC-like protein [Melghirimyces profundicolus]
MDSSIRAIPCDSPEQKMWNLFLLLENEPLVRSFLEKKYRRSGLDRPERAAFRAAQPLIYYVKQAREYYRAARISSLFARPLLAYYGMMTLTKALVLSRDPDYPRNTAVMRHGVSTAKRKRGYFRFFEDKVRVQRHGLFPELARLKGEEALIGKSWSTRELFSLIPEMQDGYRQLFLEETLYPVAVFHAPPDEKQGMAFYLEDRLLDGLHLTPRGLAERLNHAGKKGEVRFAWEEQRESCHRFRLFWQHRRVSHVNRWGQGFDHPFFREDIRGGYYLFVRSVPAAYLPELFVHYLLLFHLSMLCRYEPPLWGEMIYGMTSEEMVLIEEFLQVTQRKFPNLVLNELFEEKILFRRA